MTASLYVRGPGLPSLLFVLEGWLASHGLATVPASLQRATLRSYAKDLKPRAQGRALPMACYMVSGADMPMRARVSASTMRAASTSLSRTLVRAASGWFSTRQRS